MRAVSFLDKVEYEFVGNFLQDAICLGDADNDKGIELVAANLHGDLAVFKYRQSRPWATASDLGAVASVVVGEITNDSQNKIVSISCDGWCNIFALQSDATEEERKHMAPLHSQRLPANTKMALLADINGDGKVELILGLTDRVVRTYQWTCFLENGSEGKLVGLQKWEFANQVGTISLSANQAGGLALLVAQPGGTYTKLDFGSSTPDSGEAAQVCPQHHKLDSSHMRNPNVSSAILGGVRGTRDGRLTDSLMALATLDGTLMLVDGDNILWSLQVDHQLSALTKLDIVGDGRDEVIACAWDGQTYIVDEDRQSVRFQFDEAVCTFTAGRPADPEPGRDPALPGVRHLRTPHRGLLQRHLPQHGHPGAARGAPPAGTARGRPSRGGGPPQARALVPVRFAHGAGRPFYGRDERGPPVLTRAQPAATLAERIDLGETRLHSSRESIALPLCKGDSENGTGASRVAMAVKQQPNCNKPERALAEWRSSIPSSPIRTPSAPVFRELPSRPPSRAEWCR
ncbi:KICSTOR complex protein ITFG2 isoform X1 [Ixodes scapularis]|uniref:KICSTOR complex protein ITFG2 isoform X1 n=1 Tax=Ixodes scapularis TaxID=6945 RepID=UPI001C380A5B|nr:KICSTOR complex protein ITFG2 isoform X1 [Ixodes scapularis]